MREQIDQQMSKVAEAKARVPEKQSDARKVYNAARRAEELAYRNARELHTAFIDRLRSFRVLDPACGSGNFLYLSLLSLKDIEHRANLDAEVLGLGRPAPAYTLSLRAAWPEVSGASDLVTYWFAKAWKQMQAEDLGLAGFVTTNSIRGGSNREVLKPVVEGGRIFSAWSDEEWTVEGAAVRVKRPGFSGGSYL